MAALRDDPASVVEKLLAVIGDWRPAGFFDSLTLTQNDLGMVGLRVKQILRLRLGQKAPKFRSG